MVSTFFNVFNINRRGKIIDGILLTSFFISGVCALIYQTAWQRVLYRVIGVDTDSITIIVSVFMLGIGLGGILGGVLADRWPHLRVKWYAIAEFSISIYGFFSLSFLGGLERILTYSEMESPAISAIACMLFLMLPTTLMGVTLPLLTMAFNERKTSIGVSVGVLYFSNTMGAAVGAIAVPLVFLQSLGLNQVINVAVLGNAVVAIAALISLRFQGAQSDEMP